MSGTVTIKDIAKDSGFSQSTVSLVLQDSPLVADQTRHKVKESAKKLGYVYNRAAASLRGSRSGNFGLIISSISNPYFAEVVTGVDQQISGLNKSLIMGQHDDNPKVQERLMNLMIEARVDGVMLVPAHETRLSWMKLMQSVDFEILLLTRRFIGVNFPYFGADSADAAYLATKHLISHGVRSIFLVGGHSQSAPFQERKTGVLAAVKESGISINDVVFLEATPTQAGGYKAAIEIFQKLPKKSGVLAYNDITATGVLAALRDLRIKVGLEVPVIGIDDIENSKYLTPPLTTISNSPREIGQAAATFLVNASSENGLTKKNKFMIKNNLEIRESCGCKQKGDKK